MEYNTGEKYLKEIGHVSVLESVDEIFNGITSLMTQNAILYGSTITSLLTELPVVGDLDIAVSTHEYGKMTHAVTNSVKWIQASGRTIHENQGSHQGWRPSGLKASSSAPSIQSDRNPYEEAEHLPVSNVVSFITTNDACVQIMESKIQTGDALEDALDIVRNVDFVFCGIAVDRYGRVLEAVPNAYDDCMQRIIRINDYRPGIEAKRLKARLDKYIARGWSLGISIDQIMDNLKKANDAYAKSKAVKKKSRPALSSTPGFRYRQIVGSKTDNVVITVNSAVINIIGNKKSIVDVVRSFGNRIDDGVKLDYSSNPGNVIEFWGANKHLTINSAKTIMKQVYEYFAARHNLSRENVLRCTKKKSMSETYGTPKSYKGATTGRYSSGGYSTSDAVRGKITEVKKYSTAKYHAKISST